MKVKIYSSIMISLSILVACGEDQQPQKAIDTFSEIQSENYRSWQRAPGYATRQPSNAPHSDNVDIYINNVVVNTLENESGLSQWPNGSKIVKDGFTDDGALAITAVMKRTDGDWFFAEYDEDGNTLYSGQPSVCLGCHTGNGVLAFELP